MKRLIQVNIVEGEDGYYTATCVDFPIVTQAKTLDALRENLKEAINLHFEGDDLREHGYERDAIVVASFEMALTDARS